MYRCIIRNSYFYVSFIDNFAQKIINSSEMIVLETSSLVRQLFTERG